MTVPDQRQPDTESDLFWLAFRYVEGELSPQEAAQFELRLDDEQAARQAVAEAAELAMAVCHAANSADKPAADLSSLRAAEPSPLQGAELSPASRDWSSSRTWSAPAVWLSFGTAACIALAMTIYWFEHRSVSVPDGLPPSPVAKFNARQTEARLADAWAAANWRIGEDGALLDAGAVAAEADYASLPEDLIGELFAVDSDEHAIDADWEPVEGELIISDWLLEAISAERAAASKSEHWEG